MPPFPILFGQPAQNECAVVVSGEGLVPDCSGIYYLTGENFNDEEVWVHESGDYEMWKGATSYAISAARNNTSNFLWVRLIADGRIGNYAPNTGSGRTTQGTAIVAECPVENECDTILIPWANDYPIVKNVKLELIADSVVWDGDPGNEYPPEVAALLNQPLYFPMTALFDSDPLVDVYRNNIVAASLSSGDFSFNQGISGYTEIWEWQENSQEFQNGGPSNLPAVAISGPFDNNDTDNLPDNHFIWWMSFSNGNFTVEPLAHPLSCDSVITRPVSFRQRPYTSPTATYTQGHGVVRMTAVLDSEVPE